MIVSDNEARIKFDGRLQQRFFVSSLWCCLAFELNYSRQNKFWINLTNLISACFFLCRILTVTFNRKVCFFVFCLSWQFSFHIVKIYWLSVRLWQININFETPWEAVYKNLFTSLRESLSETNLGKRVAGVKSNYFSIQI